MKTILLENDTFMWPNLEDFCKSFDPEFKVVSTNAREWDLSRDVSISALLAQPTLERCITASAFETEMVFNGDMKHQLHHFVDIIMHITRFREKFGYKPLTFEIEYHGIDLISDIKNEKWGWDCSATLKTLIRQHPELVVNVYEDYKFKYRLTEENLY